MTNTPICRTHVQSSSRAAMEKAALAQARQFFGADGALEVLAYQASPLIQMPDGQVTQWEASIPVALVEDPPTARRDQQDDLRGRFLRHGAMRTATPFSFSRDEDGDLSLASAVFQALGAASTCWEHMEGTGEFDSTRARSIGDALVEEIRQQFTYSGPPRDTTADDAKGWR